MIVAVDQPNYIPWKGYFDMIHDVDLFIFYNDVQYTTRDWRNRNIIKTPNGAKWLTVPVCRGARDRRICDVEIADSAWQRIHYETIRFAYGKAPYFKKYKDFLEDVYLDHEWKYLRELDEYMIKTIATDFLGCRTRFADSRNYSSEGHKHEKLLSLLGNLGDNITYESGPMAKDYIMLEDYQTNNIKLVWKSYDGYPEYSQMYGTFDHHVSILDLLFHVGDEAPYYIWGWRTERDSSWQELT